MEPSPSMFGGMCHAEAQCMVNYKYLDSKRAVCITACYMYLRLSFCICRSNQIASNSVVSREVLLRRYSGTNRTCTFSRSIRADDLGKSRPAQSMGAGDYIIAAYRAGKSARIVCSTISP